MTRLLAETPLVAFDGADPVPIETVAGTPIDPTRRWSCRADVRYLVDYGAHTTVPTSLCEHIRRRRHQSVPSPELATRLGVGEQLVKFHARGDCEHVERVPPARGQTTRWQCACWRRRSQLGDTAAEIRDRSPSDVALRRVEQHVRGECSHDDGLVAPNPRQTIDQETCLAWRRRSDDEPITEIATDTAWGYGAVWMHANGRCGHEASP